MAKKAQTFVTLILILIQISHFAVAESSTSAESDVTNSSAVEIATPEARFIDGIPIDTFQRFPHHVTIRRDVYVSPFDYCSGSIIAADWVLTSFRCVQNARKLRLDFLRMSYNRQLDSFSITIGNSSVHPYPTGFDDLALIQLPVNLRFSEDLLPIPLFSGNDIYLEGEFAVMAGFTDFNDHLAYTMLQILSKAECRSKYGRMFDEFLQLCTQGYYDDRHVPCEGNEGGGLITGWPRSNVLVAVFSSNPSCGVGRPGIYTSITRYIKWISAVTGILFP